MNNESARLGAPPTDAEEMRCLTVSVELRSAGRGTARRSYPEGGAMSVHLQAPPETNR
jgi:hypothetical protein